MTQNKAKQFILGIGAQRTGSTWLRSQLHQCEQINLGFCKEYHFLDVLYLPEMKTYHDNIETPNTGVLKRLANEVTTRKAQNNRRLVNFVQNPKAYFDYFDRLWGKSVQTIAVGDFTPSYSMLEPEAFQYAKTELERRDFVVKVIFIMRDPVERIWSMKHKEESMKQAIRAGHDPSTRKFSLESFTFQHTELRTRYERTIQAIEKVFSVDDIFYDFYERYISIEHFNLLTDFIGIKRGNPKVKLVRNASYMKSSMDSALAAEVANYYQSTYQFVEAKFGTEVRSLWKGYQYI